MGDVGDIETSSSDGGCDEDRCSTGFEGMQSRFSFSLSPVSVNRGSGVSVTTQEITNVVGVSFSLDKDQNETPGFTSQQQIEQQRFLVLILDVFDSLSNVFRSRSYSSDGKEDVVLQE